MTVYKEKWYARWHILFVFLFFKLLESLKSMAKFSYFISAFEKKCFVFVSK